MAMLHLAVAAWKPEVLAFGFLSVLYSVLRQLLRPFGLWLPCSAKKVSICNRNPLYKNNVKIIFSFCKEQLASCESFVAKCFHFLCIACIQVWPFGRIMEYVNADIPHINVLNYDYLIMKGKRNLSPKLTTQFQWNQNWKWLKYIDYLHYQLWSTQNKY